MPSSLNWPLRLTLLRVALVPVFVALLLVRTELGWVLGLFAVMAATDKLDGVLARRWNQITPLGTWLDPAADKLLVSLSLLILALPVATRIAVPWPVVAGVYLKDAGVAIGAAVVYRVAGRLVVRPSTPGRVSTVAQLSLVVGTLLASLWAKRSPAAAGTFAWLLWWGTVVTAAVAAADYGREGARQIRSARAVASEPRSTGGTSSSGV